MSVRRLVVPLLAVGLSALSVAPALGVPARSPGNQIHRYAVDELSYDRASRCARSLPAGSRRLIAWLDRNVRGGLASTLRCERLGDGWSLHAEGRAIDWALDVRRPAERREAERLLGLLFAEDRFGTPTALARRMGIVEAIWDCRYFSSFQPEGGPRPYDYCYRGTRKRKRYNRTQAHEDHIHLGLSIAGARGRTSFWRCWQLRANRISPSCRRGDADRPLDPMPEFVTDVR